MTDSSGIDRLTPEELDVLRLLSEGLTSHGISDRLGIDSRALASTISVILDKLGMHAWGDPTVARHLVSDDDVELRADLRRFSPHDRELLHRWLVADQWDRNAAETNARTWRSDPALARLIGLLGVHPGQHRRVGRLLREIEAEEG
jgi:Bacterial regulatory proteins, luxR family